MPIEEIAPLAPRPVAAPGSDPKQQEAEYVLRVLGGDAQAFAGLIDRHLEPVKAFVATRLSEPTLVNEITQEAFVFAYNHLGSFEAGTSFSRWIRAIAWNLVRRELQRFAREKKNLDRYLEHCLAQAQNHHPFESEMDELAYLQDCIGHLPHDQQEILELRYWKGLSAKEIGRCLGFKENNVRTTLFRIRQHLKRCIERKALSGLPGG